METARLLWNVKEAGAALGISPWTIRRYIADGTIKSVVRLGRRVLLEPSECRRLIDEGRRQSSSISHKRRTEAEDRR